MILETHTDIEAAEGEALIIWVDYPLFARLPSIENHYGNVADGATAELLRLR